MTLSLASIKMGVTRSFGRGSLLLQKYSPEILLTVGLTGMVTAAFLAARATLKANEITEQLTGDLEAIRLAEQENKPGTELEYTDENKQKDLAIAYVQTGLRFTKLYAPSVGLGVLSISAILAAHGIMAKRQVALVAAYNLLQEGYHSYRQRVVEELGEDADKMYALGLREREVTELEEDAEGHKTKVKKQVQVYDPNTKSLYARFFDETSSMWRNDSRMNLFFLKTTQNYMNDRLIAYGHVFLNEVYDALGFPRTKEGAIVGWILLDSPEQMQDEKRDGHIDFDIYNIENGPGRDFVNGYNKAILLDFNVDGIIYDKI